MTNETEALKKRNTLHRQVLLGIGCVVFVALVADYAMKNYGKDGPAGRPDPVVKRLRYGGGLQLSPEMFYAGLKQFENADKARVDRDGLDVTISSTAANCDRWIAKIEDTVPNGATLRCKDGSQTIWLLERK